MSEKPQEVLSDDLLEQIIAQGLEKIKAPAQAAAAEEAPPEIAPSASGREGGVEDSPPTDRKTRQSAVYLYLLVLFGAAFLMLLLAFFIQQRSSEDTISDLRDSMNLSREELLDEIGELKKQNAALNEELDRWKSSSWQWQAQYEEESREAADLQHQFDEAMKALNAWSATWTLDQHYRAGDYESCAAVFLMQAQGLSTYSTDSANARHREIRRAVIDAGLLDENYAQHPEDYSELLEAYFGKLGVSVQWTDTSQRTDTVQWAVTTTG